MKSLLINFQTDFAWIEETSMKPYEEYRETLTKDKKSKAMVQVSAVCLDFLRIRVY